MRVGGWIRWKKLCDYRPLQKNGRGKVVGVERRELIRKPNPIPKIPLVILGIYKPCNSIFTNPSTWRSCFVELKLELTTLIYTFLHFTTRKIPTHIVIHIKFWYNLGSPNSLIRNQVKHLLILLISILLLSSPVINLH